MGTGPGLSERTAAIVLAAGSARRFGGGKLLASYRGAPLLHGALAAARAAPVSRIVVVTGADRAAVEACVRAFDPGVTVVHAADHAAGMSASLRAGLEALPDGIEAAFIFLGDMPRTPHAILRPMAEAVVAGAPAAAPVYAGRRGNPVVLSRALFPEVSQLEGDVGARPVLEALGPRLARIEAPDDGVLFDVDERHHLGS